MSILKAKIIAVFLGNVSITFRDEAGGKDSKGRETYRIRTVKTYSPFKDLISKRVLNNPMQKYKRHWSASLFGIF